MASPAVLLSGALFWRVSGYETLSRGLDTFAGRP